MRICLTRDSVAMSDDADAPHNSEITVADNTSVAAILEIILHSNYLASIAGGKATWSAISNIPIAVLAQQWVFPRLLTPIPALAALKFVGNTLFIHFNYHTQQDPDLIYEQLDRTHMRRNHQ